MSNYWLKVRFLASQIAQISDLSQNLVLIHSAETDDLVKAKILFFTITLFKNTDPVNTDQIPVLRPGQAF